MFVPVCCRRKPLGWWLSKAQIHEILSDSRTSSGAFLLLCSFNRTAVFVPIGRQPVKSQVLWAMVPSHGLNLTSDQTVIGYSHDFYAALEAGHRCDKGL